MDDFRPDDTPELEYADESAVFDFETARRALLDIKGGKPKWSIDKVPKGHGAVTDRRKRRKAKGDGTG